MIGPRPQSYVFDTNRLADPSFDAVEFVSAYRKHASLETMREHLQGYQKDLRQELYELINRDLGSYLDLSPKLSGCEAEALEVRAPLQEYASNVLEAQQFAAARQAWIQSKISEHRQLKKSRSIAQRQLNYLETLKMLEALAGTWEGKVQDKPVDLKKHCTALLEATQACLSLYADMDVRVQQAENIVLKNLTSTLRSVICPDRLSVCLSHLDQPEPSITINSEALGLCLASLVSLGRPEEAERVVARLLVLPLIDLNFTQSRLDGGSRGSCSGLRTIYACTLHHVKRYISPILDASHLHNPADYTTPGSSSVTHQRTNIDLLCNGVWKPIQQALCTRFPSLFAPGIAATFHANYVLSMTFLEDLSRVVDPLQQAVVRHRLRTHLSTQEFKQRWNLPVYFYLRFTEISAIVDAALQFPPLSSAQKQRASTTEEASVEGKVMESEPALFKDRKICDVPPFTYTQFKTIWASLAVLWQPDVYLRPLTQRLFRLMLQILARFHDWFSPSLQGMSQRGHEYDSHSELGLSGTLVVLAWDVYMLSEKESLTALQAHVVRAVDAGTKEFEELVHEGLAEALQPFVGVAQQAWDIIHQHVLQQCNSGLQAAKGITATYRMTNKRPPKAASPYVANILGPVRELDRVAVHRVPECVAESWKDKLLTAITYKYLEVIRDLLASVEQMEDALKKRKQRAKPAGQASSTNSTATDTALSDSQKIKLQVYLDVTAFSEEVLNVGGSTHVVDGSAARELYSLVGSAKVLLEELEQSS